MPLDPQVKDFLNMYNQYQMPALDSIDPKMIRAMEQNSALQQIASQTDIYRVEDRTIPLEDRQIPVRLYTPTDAEVHPALVFYHGGGWVLGSLDSHDELCRKLAREAECVVISVDYRLAPEHPFPAAVWDAYDSLHYIAEHAGEYGIDAEQIAVGGDSAGGNLATVACIIARDKSGPSVCYQLLFYPSTGNGTDTRSYRENSQGYLLTADMMNWFRKCYFEQPDDENHPYASPVLSSDLNGLPPAMIITAEYDPLRDSGAEYARRLQEEGVEVEYLCYDGMIHGFVTMSQLDRTQEAIRQAAARLRQVYQMDV
ncbi:alpha/beta hydrolase [Paenibacillus shenyangensis]|uniref:alpha/beta hydrolase n=1 Tax=Paenibacillus sp. A9 TaxID=1284352 RepID=UPI000367BB37|nr:alpha/beta hydrolase [Paenibacillus sp. A9]